MNTNKSDKKLSVLMIITGLHVGGAERSLARLVRGLHKQINFEVISLAPPGPVAKEIEALGVCVTSLNLSPSIGAVFGIFRLIRLIKKISPDVVKTWMYHADLIGGIAARCAGIKILYWGVRHSDLSTKGVKSSTRLIARLNAVLSHFLPTKVVYNSNRGMELHQRMGFSRKNAILIPNGFDCSIFNFNKSARESFQAQYDIEVSCRIVGLVARYDPLKNHFGFIEAAAHVIRQLPETIFVMAGRGIDEQNKEISYELNRRGIRQHFRLLGEVRELANIYSSLDVLSLSSTSESFPNVLGEAMACGVRCVSTDVGDARQIIGETGVVVPANDMLGLAAGIVKVLKEIALHKNSYCALARQRILDEFNNTKSLETFSSLFLGQKLN